jgi:hypothetical protein
VFKRRAAQAIVTAARASVTADSNFARPLCALPTPQRTSVVSSRDRASASADSTAYATLRRRRESGIGLIGPHEHERLPGAGAVPALAAGLDGHTTRLWL